MGKDVTDKSVGAGFLKKFFIDFKKVEKPALTMSNYPLSITYYPFLIPHSHESSS